MMKKAIFTMIAAISFVLSGVLFLGGVKSADAALVAQGNIAARFKLDSAAADTDNGASLTLLGSGHTVVTDSTASDAAVRLGGGGLKITGANSDSKFSGSDFNMSAWVSVPSSDALWAPLITFNSPSGITINGVAFTSLALCSDGNIEAFNGSIWISNGFQGTNIRTSAYGLLSIGVENSGTALVTNYNNVEYSFPEFSDGNKATTPAQVFKTLLQKTDLEIYIGYSPRSSAYANGSVRVDDIRLYNKYLSATELSDLRSGNETEDPVDPDANTLASVEVDGVTLAGFSSSVFNYNVLIADDSYTVPDITPVISFDESEYTLDISKAKNIQGSTQITITDNESGDSNTYTFNFYKAAEKLVANYKLDRFTDGKFTDSVSGGTTSGVVGNPTLNDAGGADFAAGENATLNIAAGAGLSNGLTFQVWMKTPSTTESDWNHFLATVPAANYELSFAWNCFAPRALGGAFDGNTKNPVSTVTNDNSWHLMTFVVTPSGLTAYVDGALQYTETNTGFANLLNYWEANGFGLRLARNNGGKADEQVAWGLRDFRLYSCALTADYINAYMQDDKEIIITGTYSDGDIVVSGSTGYSYQYWIKKQIPLFADGSDSGVSTSLWAVGGDGSYVLNGTFTVEDAFADTDEVNMLIRVKNSAGTVKTFYKTFREEGYTSKVYAVESGGQSSRDIEVLRLPMVAAELNVLTYGKAPSNITITYTDANGEQSVSSTTGKFILDFASKGEIVICITTDGNSEYVQAVIYDNSVDYAYVKEVSAAISQNNTLTINPQAQKAGDGDALYSLKIGVEGRDPVWIDYGESADFENIVDDGYYIYYIHTVDSNGRVIDTYYGEFLKGSAGTDLNDVTRVYDIQVGDGVIIGKTGDAGREYQIIRYDSKGEYVVKKWTPADGTLTAQPSYKGVYRYYIRSRAVGSVCSYEQQIAVTVNAGTAYVSDLQVFVPDTVKAREVNRIDISDGNADGTTMYKFVVISKGMYVTQQWFSGSGVFFFAPNKPGDYTLEIRIISGGSLGYADDVVYSQKITAI